MGKRSTLCSTLYCRLVELSFRLKNARVRVFKGLGFAYVHLPGCRTQK